MHWAVLLGNTKTAEFLIKKGINIEEQNIKNNTPLMLACINSNLPMVEMLVKTGADINKQNAIGATPLHSVS